MNNLLPHHKAMLDTWMDCLKKDLDDMGLMIVSKKEWEALKTRAYANTK